MEIFQKKVAKFDDFAKKNRNPQLIPIISRDYGHKVCEGMFFAKQTILGTTGLMTCSKQ